MNKPWHLRNLKFRDQAILSGLLMVVMLSVLIVVGGGLLISLSTAFILVLAIYFGAITELAGSIVVGLLLKQFMNDIQALTTVWWNGDSAKNFFHVIQGTGYVHLIMVIFFFTYTVSFFTSRIKLFQIQAKTTIESKSVSS